MHLQLNVRDAINTAIDEEMERDPTVFVIGTRCMQQHAVRAPALMHIYARTPPSYHIAR